MSDTLNINCEKMIQRYLWISVAPRAMLSLFLLHTNARQLTHPNNHFICSWPQLLLKVLGYTCPFWNHSILGSGFPLTLHDKVIPSPSLTVTGDRFSVNLGASSSGSVRPGGGLSQTLINSKKWKKTAYFHIFNGMYCLLKKN